MNFLRKVFLRFSDPLLKQCYWQRLYNKHTQTSDSPRWLNYLMYCDCEHEIHRYRSAESAYPAYLLQHSFLTCIEKRQRQRSVKHWQYKPLISIQLAVYKVDSGQLQACLDSVARQLYPHWQLCIVEDGSGIAEIRKILADFKQKFPDKVKLVCREENRGITASCQEAFLLTDGDYVALLDHDDYLAPEALYEVVKLLNQYPDTDWVYSDNDQIDSHGLRCCHHAKPAWSPELLMTYNYILHLSVIRRALMQQAVGFRLGFEGSQDYDLYLRLSELSNKIRHIPRVLYSWRQSENSVSLNPENKSYAFDAAIRALNAALKRRGEIGQACYPKHSWLGSYQINRQFDRKPEIDVIHINTEHPDLSKLAAQKAITIASQASLTFNQAMGNELSSLINECETPYILFLDCAAKFIGNESLSRMVTQLIPAGVAVCTAKIINSTGQVDHCGLAYQQGNLRYPLRGWDKNMDGIGAYGALPRNVTLTSPLISLCKTKEIQSLVEKLRGYQDFSGCSIALCLELQSMQLRICADGGIAIEYTQEKFYQLTLSDHDKALLQTHYPAFFNNDDPLYHNQMNSSIDKE